MLPTIQEYMDSFRATSDYFKTLQVQSLPSKFDAHEPYFIAGGFACVFKVKQNNEFWAFKCFLQEDKHRNERLKILSDFLQQRTENYFIKTHYYTDELWVVSKLAEDGEYPTLAMPWIEGLTLGEYVHKAAKEKNTDALKTIYDEFLRLAHFLLSNEFAHGDLKHDNILVTQDQNLILIDYDGMYLPELAHISSHELGGHAYQHPKRTAQDWGKHIDDFSILVILLSLRAFILLPSLIDDHKNENLLLTSEDLQNPMLSKPLQTLWQQNDKIINSLLNILLKNLSQNNLRVLEINAFVKDNVIFGDNDISLYKTVRSMKIPDGSYDIYLVTDLNGKPIFTSKKLINAIVRVGYDINVSGFFKVFLTLNDFNYYLKRAKLVKLNTDNERLLSFANKDSIFYFLPKIKYKLGYPYININEEIKEAYRSIPFLEIPNGKYNIYLPTKSDNSPFISLSGIDVIGYINIKHLNLQNESFIRTRITLEDFEYIMKIAVIVEVCDKELVDKREFYDRRVARCSHITYKLGYPYVGY